MPNTTKHLQNALHKSKALLLYSLVFFKNPTPKKTQKHFKKHALLLLSLSIGAYIIASLLNFVVLHMMIAHIPQNPISQFTPVTHSRLSLQKPLNYFELRKIVLKRHLFNATGELPASNNSNTSRDSSNTESCPPSTLNLKLTGTILNEDPSLSVATIVDSSLKITDVYRTGDSLIDQPAQIVAIQRSKVILDHKGRTECLQVVDSKDIAEIPSRGEPFYEERTTPAATPEPFSEEDTTTNGEVIVLKDSYVEEQLGEGFVKIVEAARFVPKQDELGNPIGFRIFGIKPGTLFARIGLKNGDIINQVNSTSLRQIEQGFALYQALQDETEITIRLQRGTRPITIKLKIE